MRNRWLIGAGAAVVLVAVLVPLVLTSRDQGSYQYGKSAIASQALMLWQANREVGAETGDYGTVHSTRDACRIVVDVDLNGDGDTPESEIVRKLDRGDVIDGCVDALVNR